MFRLRWIRAGRGTRGKPPRDRTRTMAWPSLGLVACLALLQSGCQSGPFSGCGGCGGGLFSPTGFIGRAKARVFERNRAGDCCEPAGVISGAPVEYAAPVIAAPAAVGVGTTVVPSYQGPSGPLPPPSTSTVPALPPDSPSTLEPIENPPKSRVVPPANNGSSSLVPSGKTSYQTRRADPNSRIARRPDQPAEIPGLDA